MSKASGDATAIGGDVLATHSDGNGKEMQVVALAGSDGHLIGSRPDFLLYAAPAANASGRTLVDLFNTGTVPIRVRGVWAVPTFTAITGAQIGWAIDRTNSAGTGGTGITPAPLDTAGGTWPAAATSRANPTGGAATVSKFFDFYTLNEETNAAFGMLPLVNLLPQLGDRVCEIVLRQNEGMAVKQLAIANAVGLTGALLLASFDN
jgi:hypothetical protein